MKNWIITFATILATGMSPVFAHGTNGDPRAEKIFAKEFTGAQNVKWIQLDGGYLRVTFLLNGIAAETFFDADAELLGTVRNLLFNQLPLVVMQTINNQFPASVVTETKEITNADGTNYKVILEQNNKKYQVRLNSLGQVSDIQKQNVKK